MDDGLLALKWNNHRKVFFSVLPVFRENEKYSDVTIACEGKLFPVHKLILSTCSDYFKDIFDNITCNSPVIILKDISHRDLESLLNYMYLGEVEVKQQHLPELIKAAECLKIKGLATPDENINETSSSSKKRKRLPEELPNKKPNISNIDPIENKTNKNIEQPNILPIETIKLEQDVLNSNLKEEVEISKEETSHEALNSSQPGPSGVDDSIGWDENSSYDVASFDDPVDASETLQLQWSEENQKYNTGAIQDTDAVIQSSQKKSQRVYVCEYCQKIFHSHQYNDWRRHVRIHTGERPYICDYCEYRGNRKHHLSKHIQRKHKVEHEAAMLAVGADEIESRPGETAGHLSYLTSSVDISNHLLADLVKPEIEIHESDDLL